MAYCVSGEVFHLKSTPASLERPVRDRYGNRQNRVFVRNPSLYNSDIGVTHDCASILDSIAKGTSCFHYFSHGTSLHRHSFSRMIFTLLIIYMYMHAMTCFYVKMYMHMPRHKINANACMHAHTPQAHKVKLRKSFLINHAEVEFEDQQWTVYIAHAGHSAVPLIPLILCIC